MLPQEVGTTHKTPTHTLATPTTDQPLATLIALAIKTAMSPFMTRLDALKKVSMPPPQARSAPKSWQNAEPSASGTSQPGLSITQLHTATKNKASDNCHPDLPVDDSQKENQGFSLVKCWSKGKKGANLPSNADSATPMHTQINLTPLSYASAAATVVKEQPSKLPKQAILLPSITEVTVLWDGGHIDP
jgi:hypothetical protein